MARRTNAGKTCAMQGCTRDAKCGGLCNTCYQYLRYWKDRSPGDIVGRIQQVELWVTRLNSMSPRVAAIGSKKRRRA